MVNNNTKRINSNTHFTIFINVVIVVVVFVVE